MRDHDSAPSKGVPWAEPRGSPRRKSEGLRDLVLPLPEWLESPRPRVSGATCWTLLYSQPIRSQGHTTVCLSFAKDVMWPAGLLATCARATFLTHARILRFFSVSCLDCCVSGSDLKARPT